MLESMNKNKDEWWRNEHMTMRQTKINLAEDLADCVSILFMYCRADSTSASDLLAYFFLENLNLISFILLFTHLRYLYMGLSFNKLTKLCCLSSHLFQPHFIDINFLDLVMSIRWFPLGTWFRVNQAKCIVFVIDFHTCNIKKASLSIYSLADVNYVLVL